MEKEKILYEKAKDSQIIYDYLAKLFNIETVIPLNFVSNIDTEKELKKR